MSHCNMDGRHKKTDTIKKRRLEASKCAQPLLVRSNFSLEVSVCSNIDSSFFSWQSFTHYVSKSGLRQVSELMIHVNSKLTENRTYKRIRSTILKSNLQVKGHKTWVSKSECGQS